MRKCKLFQYRFNGKVKNPLFIRIRYNIFPNFGLKKLNFSPTNIKCLIGLLF